MDSFDRLVKKKLMSRILSCSYVQIHSYWRKLLSIYSVIILWCGTLLTENTFSGFYMDDYGIEDLSCLIRVGCLS